jgi:hypothetical protein
LAQPTILGLPADAVAPAPLGQLGMGATYYAANNNSVNNASIFPKQAYVQFNHLGPATLKLGRFEFFDGFEAKSSDATVTTIIRTRIASRLISNFAFTAVQRTFDGVHLTWTSGSHNVTAFAARPTEGVFQVDGLRELDIQTYYASYNRSVTRPNGAGSLRVFGIGYVDTRSNVVKTDNRSLAAQAADKEPIALGTWGADYVHVVNTTNGSTFDIIGWGAVQTGAWGKLTQRSAAVVGEAGWQSTASGLKPWVSGGYSWGSGDSDPNDSTHGTFFQLLPTPRPYARFPFYNMMNNADVYTTLSIKPVPKLAVRSELHGLRLANAADLWYLGGGAYQQSTFGYQGRPSNGRANLATVWDISADYPLTRFLDATAYYAHAWGQGVVSAIYPNGPNGQLAYFETTIHF